jgi:hypothetical protein
MAAVSSPITSMPVSKPHNGDPSLAVAAWPAAAAAQALYELARYVGLPADALETTTPAATPAPDEWPSYLHSAATRAGLQAEQVFVALDELPLLTASSGPALLRLSGVQDQPFLAIIGSNPRGMRSRRRTSPAWSVFSIRLDSTGKPAAQPVPHSLTIGCARRDSAAAGWCDCVRGHQCASICVNPASQAGSCSSSAHTSVSTHSSSPHGSCLAVPSFTAPRILAGSLPGCCFWLP